MEIEKIGVFRSPLTGKFGVPRQGGLVRGLRGVVQLEGQWGSAEALRGLEGYDYVWLIWGFSQNVDTGKHATVRPPLLGGNERVGVWATRSSFRPNNLGLSSLRLIAVDVERGCIEVEGADLMDGTPVYDIKPYLSYVDCHEGARGGFTDEHQWKRLSVCVPEELQDVLTEEKMSVLRELLALDPRPHYHDDEREYGMSFGKYNVRFRVVNGCALLTSIRCEHA